MHSGKILPAWQETHLSDGRKGAMWGVGFLTCSRSVAARVKMGSAVGIFFLSLR